MNLEILEVDVTILDYDYVSVFYFPEIGPLS
jgi:hypothetical protein